MKNKTTQPALLIAILFIFAIGGGFLVAQDTFEIAAEEISGEAFQGGSIVSLRWSSTRQRDRSVDIYFSKDNGQNWEVAHNNIRDSAGLKNWRLPKDVNSNQCLFKMILKDSNNSVLATSIMSEAFTIDSIPPSAKVVAPESTDKRHGVLLEYKATDQNGSGLKQIKLFMREQGDRSWISTKYGLDEEELAAGISEFEADFKHRGLWELYLVAEDKAGNSGRIPRVEDKAQFVIAVNSGEPKVEFMPMKKKNILGPNSKLVIKWLAQDDDFIEKPITLEYRDGRTWKVFADGIENTGRYEWALPNKSFQTSQFRITATDKQGNSMSDDIFMSVLLDVDAPEARLTGNSKINPWEDAKNIPRLNHRFRDPGGSGVEQLILYWRKFQENEWKETPLKLRSVYEKIPFDKPDGIYELILVGVDKMGNREAAPQATSEPELKFTIKRSQFDFLFTEIRQQGDELIVSWKAADPDFKGLTKPIQLTWDDLETPVRFDEVEGTHRIKLNGRTKLTLKLYGVTLTDKYYEQTLNWEGTAAPKPTLVFATQGREVEVGEKVKLLWTGQDLGDKITAVLKRNGEEIYRQSLPSSENELEWMVEGKEGDSLVWTIQANGHEWSTRPYTVKVPPAVMKTSIVFVTPRGIIKNGQVKILEWTSEDVTEPIKATLYIGNKVVEERDLEAGAKRLEWVVSGKEGDFANWVLKTHGKEFSSPLFVIEVPQLVFVQKGGEVVSGESYVLEWTGKGLNTELTAVLTKNGNEIDRRSIRNTSQLEWTPEGQSDDKFVWTISMPGQSWKTKEFVIPQKVVVLKPQIRWLTQQGRVIEGQKMLLKWEATDITGDVKARLLVDGVEKDVMTLKASQSELEWEVQGQDNQVVQWIFEYQDKAFNSPLWVIGVPNVIFVQKGGKVQPGQAVLEWTASHLKDPLTATLTQNGEVVETRTLKAKDTRLTWKVDGKQDDVLVWTLKSVGRTWSSAEFTIDIPVKPKPQMVFVTAGGEIQNGSEIVMAWTSENIDQPVKADYLVNGVVQRTQDITAGQKRLTWKVSGKNGDTLQWLFRTGEHVFASPKWTIIVPQLTFVSAAGEITPGQYVLEWKSQHLTDPVIAVLTRNDQEIDRRQLRSVDTQLTWKAEGQQDDAFVWTITSAGQVWKSPVHTLKVPVVLNPQIAFTTQGGEVVAGRQVTLKWTSKDIKEDIVATLVTDGVPGTQQTLKADSTVLNWRVEGKAGSQLQWLLSVGDKTFKSPVWTIVLPVPELVFTTRGEDVVPGQTVNVKWQAKNLHGAIKAVLTANNQIVSEQTLDESASEFAFDVTGNEGDRLRLKLTVRGVEFVSPAWVVRVPKPVLTFVQKEGRTVDVGDVIQLEWTGQHLGDTVTVIRQVNGVDVDSMTLPAQKNMLEWTVTGQDKDKVQWFVKVRKSTFASPIWEVKKPVVLSPVVVWQKVGQRDFASKSVISLQWVNKHTQDKVKVFAQQDDGEWVLAQELAAGATSFEYSSPQKDIKTLKFKLQVGELTVENAETFSVDHSTPTYTLQVPQKAMVGDAVSVTYSLEDAGPVQASSATLYFRSADGIEWVKLADVSQAKGAIDFSNKPAGAYEFSMVYQDTFGRGFGTPGQGPVVRLAIATPLKRVLQFQPLAEADRLIPSGQKVMLKWTAQNLSSDLVLERQQGQEQWVEVARLDKDTRQYELIAPEQDINNWNFRLRSGELTSELGLGWQVDHTVPSLRLTAVPDQLEEGQSFKIYYTLQEEGPAGFEEAALWFREKGTREWIRHPQKISKSGTIDDVMWPAATWELTFSITDRFGRGRKAPQPNTAPDATVLIKGKPQPAALTLVAQTTQGLVLGGSQIKVKVVGTGLPDSQPILIKDDKGQVIRTLKEPGDVVITAPRQSIDSWMLSASCQQSQSNVLTYVVDFDNPLGQLELLAPVVTGKNARVRVLAEDKGPAGLEKIELYRSDDEGQTWQQIKMTQDDKEFEIAPVQNVVHLALRVQDKVGLWSRPVLGSGMKGDLMLRWPRVTDVVPVGQMAFATFVKAEVFRGGAVESVRFAGIRETSELQWRPDPGMPWLPLSEVVAGQEEYIWKLPKINSSSVELRMIRVKDGGELFRSPTRFSIDSRALNSMLAILPSSVIEEEIVFNRPTVRPRHRPREVDQSVTEHEDAPQVAPIIKQPEVLPQTDEVLPYDFSTYLAAAKDLMRRNNYGKAATYLESAHRDRTDVAESHYMLAICYHRMNRKPQMVADELHATVDLDPTHAEAWNHLGVLAKLRQDIDQAKRYFLKSLDARVLPQTHLNLGILKAEEGHAAQARDHYLKVREMLRGSTDSPAYRESTWRLTMQYSYGSLQDIQKARHYWAEVLSLFGRDSWQGKRAIKWLRDNDPKK